MIAYRLFRARGLTATAALVGARMLEDHPGAAADAGLLDWLAGGLRGWTPHQLRTWLADRRG